MASAAGDPRVVRAAVVCPLPVLGGARGGPPDPDSGFAGATRVLRHREQRPRVDRSARDAPRRLPTAIVKLILRLLIPLLVNRVAYGSEAAAALYSPFVGSRAETTLIPLVRAPRITWTPAKPVGTVAFVGVLHERKGLPLLLRAWELVERTCPDAHLTIIGDGPLAADVTQWVSGKPETRTFLGQVSRTDVIMRNQCLRYRDPVSALAQLA